MNCGIWQLAIQRDQKERMTDMTNKTRTDRKGKNCRIHISTATLVAILLMAAGTGRVQAGQSGETKADHSGMQMDHSTMPGMTGTTASGHKDHNPKHGGIFFMAMDNIHHLEGVLESPGVFRVYLYDSHTKPLTKAQVKLITGKVLVGDEMNAPEVPLQLSADGLTLQMALPQGCPMPVTLTLLMRFPGMKKDARPELFTFPFAEFTPPNAPAHDATPSMEMHDHHTGM
jgi:hypothetical protein